MGMEELHSNLISKLGSEEINVLLKLYYNKSNLTIDLDKSDFDDDVLQNLLDKNLISTNIDDGESVLSLSDEGLNICGTVMFKRISDNKTGLDKKLQELPARAIACLVNRVMWRDIVKKESGYIDEITKPYALDESMWYERVLLKDDRIVKLLGKFYDTLEDFDLIQKIDNTIWCSPEVENFLKDKYKNIMDLSWVEEDSLKYYYFFYVYAQDQKNLIDFSGNGQQFRSMFYEGDSIPQDYWFSSNNSDPRTLLSLLGLSEKRVIDFLERMQQIDIVNERYYPLTSFSFFSEDDKIFVIRDIKAYMDFITNKFLKSIVDSLINN